MVKDPLVGGNRCAMHRSDFHYELPPERIAQYPLDDRAGARMLVVDGKGGWFEDRVFRDLPVLLRKGDVLVFNDTRVMPARLLGKKSTGGKVEVLIERITADQAALAHCRAAKAPKAGTRLILENAFEMECTGRRGDLFELSLRGEGCLTDILGAHGRLPLPPYIEREVHGSDHDRY